MSRRRRSRSTVGLDVEEVSTFKQLKRISEQQGAVYVGSSINPWDRARAHHRDGFRGILYCTRTKNMMTAEDKLLANRGRHNKYEWSGADERSGYVYTIVGQKRRR